MKKTLLILLAFAMLFSLCACGNDDSKTTAPSDSSQSTTNSAENSTGNTEAPVDGTEGTTGATQTPTDEPTTPPTQAPTDEPTIPPTQEPTETPTTPPTTSPTICNHSWKDATCTNPKTCKTCGTTDGSAAGHSWKDATCTDPKTCSKCGATDGSAAGHSWNAATCTAPKTCKTCGTTDGSAAGHSWNNATCTAPKTCKACGVTEGSAVGHSWKDATYSEPKTCKVCGATEGSKLSPVIVPGDNAVPELISFSLDKTNVKVGDVIKFVAEIKDSSTIYYAEFQFKCGADYHNVFLDNIGGNTYSGTLRITDSFVNGTYSISWISIQDYAGNTAAPSSDAAFTVENPNSTIVIAPGDKADPELISFSLDKTNVKVGDVITFTAEIKDSSTIDYAEFQFKSGADYHNVFLDNIGGNTYSGTLRITDSFVNGTYSISWISIQDYAGNTAAPSSDAAFTVTK